MKDQKNKKLTSLNLEKLSELEQIEIKGGRGFSMGEEKDSGCGSVYACGLNANCPTNSGNCVAGCACPPPKKK